MASFMYNDVDDLTSSLCQVSLANCSTINREAFTSDHHRRPRTAFDGPSYRSPASHGSYGGYNHPNNTDFYRRCSADSYRDNRSECSFVSDDEDDNDEMDFDSDVEDDNPTSNDNPNPNPNPKPSLFRLPFFNNNNKNTSSNPSSLPLPKPHPPLSNLPSCSSASSSSAAADPTSVPVSLHNSAANSPPAHHHNPNASADIATPPQRNPFMMPTTPTPGHCQGQAQAHDYGHPHPHANIPTHQHTEVRIGGRKSTLSILGIDTRACLGNLFMVSLIFCIHALLSTSKPDFDAFLAGYTAQFGFVPLFSWALACFTGGIILRIAFRVFNLIFMPGWSPALALYKACKYPFLRMLAVVMRAMLLKIAVYLLGLQMHFHHIIMDLFQLPLHHNMPPHVASEVVRDVLLGQCQAEWVL